MRRIKKQAFIVVVAISMILSQAVSFAQSGDKSTLQTNSDYLKSIMEMINDKHKGDVDQNKLVEGALKGMFSTMDDYTEYYTNEEAKAFFDNFEGDYDGIGIYFGKIGGKYVVQEVIKGSPAEKSGLSDGDTIVAVNGVDIANKNSDEIVSMVKGERGTFCTLKLIKDGETKATQVKVKRDEIIINPVTYKIDGNVAYVKLDIFNMNSAEAMVEAMGKIDEKKVTKVVLDLRDNPGGELNQAVSIARLFVPKGLITKLDFNSQSMEDLEYSSYLDETKYKLMVLVNENSASASEVLAGAIQDTKAGKLVGTKTFGKAKVQNLYPILTPDAYKKYEEKLGVKLVIGDDLENKHGISPEDSEVMGWAKITTGFYYTPNGKLIDLKGILPDAIIRNGGILNGVYIEDAKKLDTVKKLAYNSESFEVQKANMILKLCGYNVDSASKKFDAKTLAAVKKFQKDNKLSITGNLDLPTQKILNDKLEKISKTQDKQYMKALELVNK